ncbi:hypothetical protein FYJ91_01355 [Sphingomonas montanisoli]|uniref:DUF2306 domain-containing protein n=2 Tax=Sphingomonas montanisoli TaxID=2606412 RepID=A0A5D9CEM6_9SPHN|nr:hypothetical protein FYJ91_01355 [Sphingomonas montanisoli]
MADGDIRDDRGTRFFQVSAIIMALVLVAGFSVQVAMGRSTFAAPWVVHAHALIFFGWTALYLVQATLAGNSAAISLHRRLGWLALLWVPAMVAAGIAVTVLMVRRGHAPFFFTPLYFLIMNPLTVLTFAGLTGAAIVMRRRTQWHRRLMFCGMTILLGPGFGRLLPMPFLIPLAGWAAFAAIILFPIAGIVRDLRADRRVHPAWWWGVGTIVAMQVGIDLIVMSPIGDAIYAGVTAGSPGAALSPAAYPPPPSGPMITGR